MNKIRYISVLLLMFVLGNVMAFEAEVNVEFSADAVQHIPGNPPTMTRMYASKKAIRTESIQNGMKLIEIIYPAEYRKIILNEMTRTYLDNKAEKQEQRNKKTNSPCDVIKVAKCINKGKEKVNGRSTTRWEMQVNRGNKVHKSIHWIDNQYHIPVREQFPDGSMSVMTFKGKEKINNRDTEKWIYKMVQPDGRSFESTQWYDPELKIVIREALKGGFIRELKNIRTEKQDRNLFKIPEGYTKQQMQSHAPVLNRLGNNAPSKAGSTVEKTTGMTRPLQGTNPGSQQSLHGNR